LLSAGLGLVGAACASGGSSGVGPGPDERPLVELFSWWTASGEAEALEALVDAHRKVSPEARIFNAAAASGTRARETLGQRLERNDPPDLYQDYVHDLRAAVRGAAGRQKPLDDLFDSLGLRAVIYPEILRDVTTDGHVLAMPVNVHRENSLFFNRRLLAAHGVSPPSTVDELLAACRKLRAAGVTPLATAHQGWILRIMFNSIAAGTMGTVRYRDYFTGRSAPDLPRLREAIRIFGVILRDYTNADAGDEGFNWTSAAQAVYNGDAAMLLHGDWVKGYFLELGWRPDVDFGLTGAPGTRDLFLYGVDTFVLPSGATNEVGARAFLVTVSPRAGQLAFNKVKGSSSIRKDLPRDELDVLGRATVDDLEHAKIRMLVRSRPVWEEALVGFAKDRDADALLRAFLDAPPGA